MLFRSKENGTSGEYGGYIAFATRTNGAGTNTERARIDSSGRLLVGTATAPGSASVNIVSAKPSGVGGQEWHTASGGNGGIALVPTVSGGAALYPYTGAIGSESYGSPISVTTTGLDVSTAGYGLKLPATPGNADTQTLDCYAEGTWTPTLTGFGGTNPTLTARYVRVGKLVTLSVLVSATGGATFSSTATTTYISLPAGMTPTVCSQPGVTSNSGIVADGPCVAYTNGNLYLPTFALRNADTFLNLTYML